MKTSETFNLDTPATLQRKTKMKNKPKRESKKLLCPKAYVLNQLDDDRLK
jgi:hypothetical protein